MSNKALAGVVVGVVVVYLLLNLAYVITARYPIWWWLIVVAIAPFAVIIYFKVRNRYIRPQTDIQWLVDHIRLERSLRWRLERYWVGRRVVLKEDIRNPKETADFQVYVKAGAVGKIVGLNRDENAPFRVRFQEFPHDILVRLEKLDVTPTVIKRKRSDTA